MLGANGLEAAAQEDSHADLEHEIVPPATPLKERGVALVPISIEKEREEREKILAQQ